MEWIIGAAVGFAMALSVGAFIIGYILGMRQATLDALDEWRLLKGQR